MSCRRSPAWSRPARAPPGVSVMRSRMTSSTTRNRQSLEQRDALAQRRLERDLAAHRALGDRRHMGLQADIIRELVDAFLPDHGGIHVGDEQPLAPAAERLHDDIERRPCSAARNRSAIALSSAPLGVKGMSTAMPGSRTRTSWRRRKHADRERDRGIVERGLRRIGDESGDVSHRDTGKGRCLSQGRPRAASRRWRSRLPKQIGGTIVNADSMQVYRDLRIITARPTPAEEARVPHRLYGHVDAAENYSVGRWLARCRGRCSTTSARPGACRSWPAVPGSISRR